MITPNITALYAGILGIMAVVLAAIPGWLRGKLGIPSGDGSSPELAHAMRRHANFNEFVPLTLILIALLELNGTGDQWLHLLGFTLVLVRISHAVGFNADSVKNATRVFGGAGSVLLLAITSVLCVIAFF